MPELPKYRTENLVVQNLKNETLIYDLRIDKAFCLNETSALIWQLCDGDKTVSEIGRELSRKLKTLVSEDLIWLAIDEFKKNNLLDKNEDVKILFGGLSRREMIRKVSLASMISLPVISSLAAPKAIEAQSACQTTNQLCRGSHTQNNCCSGLRCATACINCFRSGIQYFNSGCVGTGCCSIEDRNDLCCDTTNPPTETALGGNIFTCHCP